jgi:hypothetical protein
MIKPRLTSVALIAAAVLATPAMARESGVASPRRELRHARYARCALHRPVASATYPALRVRAFATRPWGDGRVRCEPAPGY